MRILKKNFVSTTTNPIFRKLVVTFMLIICYSLNIRAQNKLIGKTYMAEIKAVCKEMDGGGCMIYTDCVLKFENDSVLVSYNVRADCTPKEREKNYEHMYDNLKSKYKWTIHNKMITIKNFNDYGKLAIQGKKLIGRMQMNNKFVKVEFEQQIE